MSLDTHRRRLQASKARLLSMASDMRQTGKTTSLPRAGGVWHRAALPLSLASYRKTAPCPPPLSGLFAGRFAGQRIDPRLQLLELGRQLVDARAGARQQLGLHVELFTRDEV